MQSTPPVSSTPAIDAAMRGTTTSATPRGDMHALLAHLQSQGRRRKNTKGAFGGKNKATKTRR